MSDRSKPFQNHPSDFRDRLARVQDWRRRKRVKMNNQQLHKCAKDLGISSAAVQDCLNHIKTNGKEENA